MSRSLIPSYSEFAFSMQGGTTVADPKHDALVTKLVQEYREAFPASLATHRRARRHLVDGGSHTLRLSPPFPLYLSSASGAWLQDLDGHEVLDFWQGHYANILGHNPQLVADALSGAFAQGRGLQTGHLEELQADVAEILIERTGTERVRFTTSGSLSSMYAMMLARASTGRDLILKVGGGWHGAQPWALKGIRYGEQGFRSLESLGLPANIEGETLITRFNDPEDLAATFRTHGDRIACFIVEPWIGSAGFIPATPEYLKLARSLTWEYGALLIFDEVISGFRFRAGDLGSMYGIRPDLALFGKIIGGGMPVAAVAGRSDIMTICGREGERLVRFDGGTYSAHPGALLASKVMLNHLVDNEDLIYPQLAARGEQMRRQVEETFADEGIVARCTGYGNEAVPGSSLAMIHFPYNPDLPLLHPEDLWDPKVCDVTLREQVLKLAFLLEGVYVLHGLGALSTMHGEREMRYLIRACSRVAKRIKASAVAEGLPVSSR